MTPAETLLAARRAAGLTRQQLAAAAGASTAVIAAIETGVEQPSFPVLQRLLAATGHAAGLVLEQLPDPHELGLLEVTVQLTPQQRVERLVTLHRTARALQEALGRA